MSETFIGLQLNQVNQAIVAWSLGANYIFGKKYSQKGFRVSQEDDCKKKEFQDLVILAQYTGWTARTIYASCIKF